MAYTIEAAAGRLQLSVQRTYQLVKEFRMDQYTPPGVVGWEDARQILVTAESVERMREERIKAGRI